MIECEICGKYVHGDDANECPNCGLELCPECYEKHVVACVSREEICEDISESRLLHECPECGSELQLDVDPDGSARVYCEKCGFIQELNEEQIAELNGDNE